MRRLTPALFAAALAAAPLAAQSWHPEIGVQGGFSRLKPAGTGQHDQIDAFDLPGSGFGLGNFSYSSLFAVIPVHARIAIEPSFSASEVSLAGSDVVTARVGARVDYAITPHVYGALGAEIPYFALAAGASAHSGPLAVQAAVGYRMPLAGRLNGRVELHWAASARSRGAFLNPPPFDVYAVLFGVSSTLDGSSAPHERRASRADRAWAPALGIAGGYFSVHGVGGPSYVGFSVPGLPAGVSAYPFGGASPLGLPAPASFFAIIPVGRRFAIEPGFNFSRAQFAGAGFGTSTGLTLSARADLAVGRAWYGGLGPVANYYRTTGRAGAAQLGVTAAWGYRFHLSGDLGGRLEASYSLFGHQHALGIPPVNTIDLGGGVTMAL